MKIKLLFLLAIILLAGLVILYETLYRPENRIIHINQTDQISAQNQIKLEYKEFKTLNNKTLHLDQMNEKLILINFWASWCAPCRKEFPDIFRLMQSYYPDIALIAISVDSDQKPMMEMIEHLKTEQDYVSDSIYWVWDQNKEISLRQFYTKNVPETFLIDSNRNIIAKIIGANDWKNDQIHSKIELILNK